MKAIDIPKTEFEDLLSFQCTKEDIAGFFHVSEKTIARFCQREYKKSFSDVAAEYRSSGCVSLRRAQYAAAIGGNVQMMIFLGKQWLNQTDKVETNLHADGDINVKHGEVTRVIYYDPETGNPTQETIQGADDDVKAYLRDRENYNGDTVGISLPNKDPVPDDEIKGERTIMSKDGQTRLHLPIDGREELHRHFTIKNGETGAEALFPDDGRGGYGIAVLDDYDDGRGGYATE